jgi:hypothetical protein
VGGIVSRPLHRCALRFSRTADEAFRTPRYASALEIPTRPSFWRRVLRFFGWL